MQKAPWEPTPELVEMNDMKRAAIARFNELCEEEPRAHYTHHAAQAMMEAAKGKDGFFGVEGIDAPDACECGMMYLNTGDTYAITLIFDEAERWFIVSSVGDLIEGDPKRWAPTD